MIDSDKMTRILLDVAINRTAKNPQDTPEEAELRKKFVIECDAIEAKGGEVEIPGDFN